jgi:hypothetical protein
MKPTAFQVPAKKRELNTSTGGAGAGSSNNRVLKKRSKSCLPHCGKHGDAPAGG